MTYRVSSLILLVALVVVAAPSRAAAQEPARRLNFSGVSFMPMDAARAPVSRFDARPSSEERSRPSVLMTSLYAATAITQGLDAHSTLKAINSGATERNPMMSYLTSHPSAFVAVKAGAAAGLILAGRNLAKHNKKHAVILLAAVNSAYVVIAVHNYRVAGRFR